MLWQRVLTGVTMLALFLAGMAFLDTTTLAIVFAGVATAGAWEWAPLAGWQGRVGRVLYSLLFLGILALLVWHCDIANGIDRTRFQPLIGAACLFWSAATLLVESYPNSAWLWRSRLARSVMGFIVLAAAWLSIVYLLGLTHGPLLIVILILLVVVADVGAFFTGKSLGKHKLAPSVSPGKTWEGLWGGLAGALALTVGVWAVLPPDYAHLELGSLIVIGLACTGASVLGDLTVSMVKRGCGVKDSGTLLPGHGGLLDRLDSICGASPVFALALMLVGY